MQKLTSLINSLYQDFFTGKGTLCLNLHLPVREEGDRWHLETKKGSLSLTGSSRFAIVQALSYLRYFPVEQIDLCLGVKKPIYSVRALSIKNHKPLTDSDLSYIVALGFNTLIVKEISELDRRNATDYGLKVLTDARVSVDEPFHRSDLLKDRLKKEVENLASNTLFLIPKSNCFEELHFTASDEIYFTFDTDTNLAYETLSNASFYPSNFLAPLSLSRQDLNYFALSKIEAVLEKMKGRPFKGLVVYIDEIPDLSPSSHETLNLWAVGHALIGLSSPLKLYDFWLQVYAADLKNKEAINLVEAIAANVEKKDIKIEKNKALSDLAVLERWPSFSQMAQTLKLQLN